MSSARPPSGIVSSAFLSSLSAANRLNGPKESTSLDCRLRRSFIGVIRVSRGPSVRVHAERTVEPVAIGYQPQPAKLCELLLTTTTTNGILQRLTSVSHGLYVNSFG